MQHLLKQDPKIAHFLSTLRLNFNMANLAIKNFNLLRRSFVVTAEHEKVQAAVSGMSKATETDSRVEVRGGKKENFWMPDPKTGNFIPERHFGEIDVAELREKKLSKKQEQ